MRASSGSGFGGRGFFRPRGPCPAPAVKSCGLQAVHRGPAAGGTAVPALPGDGVGVEHAAGGEPDQDVDRAAEEPVGEGGGAVAGVEDEQRRGLPAVPGGAQAAQHVPHLRDRLRCAGRGRGARHVGQRGPRGAQVPDCRGELVLPAGRGLGLSPGSGRRRCARAPGPGSTTRPAAGKRSHRRRTAAGSTGRTRPAPARHRPRAARPAPCPAARDRSRRAPRSTRVPPARPRPAAVPTPAGRRASRRRSARRTARHTARRGRG